MRRPPSFNKILVLPSLSSCPRPSRPPSRLSALGPEILFAAAATLAAGEEARAIARGARRQQAPPSPPPISSLTPGRRSRPDSAKKDTNIVDPKFGTAKATAERRLCGGCRGGWGAPQSGG